MKLLTLLLAAPLFCFAQFNDTIQLPVIEPVQHSVYISTTGSDSNAGDSLNPVATFLEALDKLDSITTGHTGDVYTEVVLFAGTYLYHLGQPYNKYEIGAKRLNVSVRGKGDVKLDGTALSITGGTGMVHLLGSHISVKNLNILYSPANGVRFGFDYNGTVINSHDILIEHVEVAQTGGHGIIVGIGPVNTANAFVFTPLAERFLIRNCSVHHSVNFNQPQSQWGSSIKFHNVKHGTAMNCVVHDNSGEGINVNYCQYINVHDNEVYDNYANVYLDNAEYVIVRNNLIYTTHRHETGILLGLEAFSALVTDHYMRNIFIANNIILNTPTAISIWQGTYSGIQNGYFTGIKMLHNTMIGKLAGNPGVIGFSYVTILGQPAPNVIFADLELKNNIISAHPDSMNHLNIITSALNPQPGLTFSSNLWSTEPRLAYDSTADRIDTLLPAIADPAHIETLIPHADSNSIFVMTAPRVQFVDDDHAHTARFIDSTNVGAFELDTTTFSDTTIIDGIADVGSSLLVYPNPFSAYTQIKLSNADNNRITIELFDLAGKTVQHDIILNNDVLILSREGLTSGIYFCKVQMDGKVFTAKLLVQ